MNILKFKTSINCNGCRMRVSPFLDKAEGIIKWDVDVDNPNKILTVETVSLTAPDVIGVVNKAGYFAEAIQ
jgi:copper chaperone